MKLWRSQKKFSLLLPGGGSDTSSHIWVGNILTRISDLKIGDKSVEDMHRLCSCVSRAHGSLPEVDTQWVRTKISPFNSPSTGFCASIFKDHG